MSGGHIAYCLRLATLTRFIAYYLRLATLSTVNHLQNFVDPTIGAHINSDCVEGYWSCITRQMRRQGVMNTSNDLFSMYLLEILRCKRLV